MPAAAAAAPSYRRRDPRESVLRRVVRTSFETFAAQWRERSETGRGLPKYVENEFRTFVGCGDLARGFLRAHCGACGHSTLVAFSCGGRVVCASCATRRMESLTAHLVEDVLPEVSVRQWTLSLPFDLRRLLACRPELLSAVHTIFIETVFGWLRGSANVQGVADGRCGAVSFIQRFNQSLGADVHFHLVALDGVYSAPADEERPTFHEVAEPRAQEVHALAGEVAARTRRLLHRRGLLNDDGEPAAPASQEPTELEELFAAAAQDRVPEGRLDTWPERQAPPRAPGWGSLRLAEVEGFHLHADVRVEAADRKGRERLCRYGARPAFAEAQFSEARDGRIAFELRKPRRGQTHLFFTHEQLLRRLAWLIPPPRQNLLRYEGVLAPASKLRARIVPDRRPGDATALAGPPEPLAGKPGAPVAPLGVRRYWAELIKRVHGADALECPRCQGRMRIIAAVQSPSSVRRILEHLGLPTEPQELSPAREAPYEDLLDLGLG
jgi:ribosomal protein S27E